MNSQELANEILKNVGSEANVHSLVHCVTRLRFKLLDNNKANKKDIENLEGVLSVVESGGQFQVVIGNKVGEVYKEIMKLIKLEDENIRENNEVKEKSNIGHKVLDLISSIFAPILAILASVSILKGLLAIFVYLNYISTTSSTYEILHVIEDSALYFMPILIAFTAAKKFGASEFIAVTLGAILIHPGTSDFISKHLINFHGIPIKGIDYNFTFMPVIVSVWLLSKLEKFIDKTMNGNLKLFFKPIISLIIIAPLTLIIIGPAVSILTEVVGTGYNFIYGLSPILFGAIVGGFWQALVIKGIHWGAMPIVINNLSLYGKDTIMALAISGGVGQAGAVLGVVLKTKDKNIRKAAIATIPTGFLGVTEPTIYGVTLKYKIPFICGSIGGAVGGAIAGYSGSAAMGYIIPGFLTLPVYFGKGFGGLIIAVITSYIMSAILSFISFKDPKENKNINGDIYLEADVSMNGKEKIILKESNKTEIISSPLKGKIIDLSQVSDKVFAEGTLGKGIAIVPSEGKLFSPADGIISVVFPTGHAIAITSDDGAEILMHIGFDTVGLNGRHFNIYAIQGEKVKKGELLVEFDLVNIKKEGFDVTTPIVVTNSDSYFEVNSINTGFVKQGYEILSLKKQ